MDYITIGKTTKPHGFKGELRVTVDEQWWDDFESLEVMFVLENNKPIPYFIESIKGSFPDVQVTLEDIDSAEAAKRIANKPLQARKSDLSDADAPAKQPLKTMAEFSSLVGYTIIDSNTGALSEILAVEVLPGHELAILEINEEEVLIPLHQKLITRIDHKHKQLFMDLPEGLF